MTQNRLVWMLVGASLWIILGLPSTRAFLEGGMATHMLVQIPLLAVAGALVGKGVRSRVVAWSEPFNRHGVTGIVLAALTIIYWMVPLNLDSALSDSLAETAKFITVPVAVGMVGTLSWDALPGVAKALIVAQMISMLDVMAWLYRDTPVQLCNYYLLDQQVLCADLMLLASTMLAVGCTIWSLFRAGVGAPNRCVPLRSDRSLIDPASCAISGLR